MPSPRRYTFKLYPAAAQAAALEQQCVLLARLWNAALEQREIQWSHEVERKGNWHKVSRPKEEKPAGLSYYDQARQLKFIRADDPEYAAMCASSLELCLAALDNAFKAFWRRLKEGKRGDEAGYPRYKRVADHGTIWHRDGIGWKFEQAGKHWKLRAKGVPGLIKARGRFPAAPVEHRSMEIIRREGTWWLSIVVLMDERRRRDESGLSATVHFDLIDEFARVETCVDGRSAPGSIRANSVRDHGVMGETEMEDSLQPRTSSPLAHEMVATAVGEDDDAGLTPARGMEVIPFAPTPEMEGVDFPPVVVGRESQLAPAYKMEVPVHEVATDGLQSARDRRFKKFSNRWKREKRRIAKLKAREARQRREALHRWTTGLVEAFSEIAVIAPPIKESTRSARGGEKRPGAAVAPVAALNRHVLAQAPALAIQMLEYKSAEAGIPFARITPDEHALAIGRDLPAATKAARTARHELRRKAA